MWFFLKSEMSLNHSTFDQLDIAKTKPLTVTRNCDVISLLTLWKLNKLSMNCELSKYLLNNFNSKNVTGVF